MLLTCKEMPTPGRTWGANSWALNRTLPSKRQVSAGPEVRESRVQIRPLSIVGLLVKPLILIVTFLLPLVFSLVRVQDDAAGFLGSPKISNFSNSERWSDSPEHRAGAVNSSDNAFELPTFDYRSWVDTEDVSIWASADVQDDPVWIEWTPLPLLSSDSEFRLSHTNALLDSRSGRTEEGIEETVPTSEAKSRLARLTVYWPEEGDHHTRRRMSSTGVYLREGHCAVDPKVIPYGSLVKIPGMGEYVAVDTGPAVVSRRAARTAGRTSHERKALVVDIFCSSRSQARAFEENAPKFAVITWYR